METQYCPRPPLSPPPTPPPDPSRADPSDLLLNEESDELWISALDIARSLEDPGIQIDPHHLILALLYKGINNIDDVIVRFREPPILDIPLLWKVVQEAGGNPQALAIDIRQRWLSELQIRPIDEQTPQDLQPTPDQHVLLRNCSEETKEVLLAAKDSLAKTDDSFVAPHHIILALMENYRVASLLISQNLNPARLASLTRQYRPHRVVTRKNKPRFLVLKQFASDLTEEAKQDRIGPVIGRDEEIRRLTVILSRRYKCNAILLGESGVGKTAVAEGLALRICSRDVPEELNCRIFSLDMGSLLASTTCHGKLELRVKAILEEIQENEAEGVKIILYIDSFHLITMGRKTGGAGGMDVANLMKPLLARGKLRCFGSATYHDYKNSVETDGSLVRRFAPIVICEPTAPQTVTILRGLKSRMEKHHTLSITDAALEEAAYLSARYVAYKRLPDSAIELVDEACSMLRVNQVLRPESLDKLLNKKRTLEQEIRCLSLEWERNSVDSQIQRMRAQESLQSVIHDIEAAEKDLSLEQNLKNKIMKLEAEIAIGEVELKRIAKQKKSQRMRSAEVLRGKLRKNKEDLKRAKKEYFDDSLCSSRVTPAVIAQVISEQTEIPIQSVMAHERPYYISLEKDLNNAVAGQPEATRAISQAIHFSRSGFSNPGRPVASMLLVGGPGTGKTFIAKELARLLFDSEEKLLVINGAEYTSTLNLIRLIGTPSCSGYDQGGELTECIKRKPFCIVLVDNIDKACPEFHVKFRMLIDQGRLEDGDGKVVDFRNCIILMTTAIGSEFITSRRAVLQEGRAELESALVERFSAEFLNCLDVVVPFIPLTAQDLERIFDIRLRQLQKHLQERGITLEMDSRVKERILLGRDGRTSDARTLLRRFRDEVEDHLGPLLVETPAPCRLRVTELGGSTRITSDLESSTDTVGH